MKQVQILQENITINTHINKGPEQSANVKELCDLEAKSVPNDILTVMNNNKQKYKPINTMRLINNMN